MNKPYFSEGEEIILQSPACPEFWNDEAVVDKVVFPGEYWIDRLTGQISILSDSEICYLLSSKHSDRRNYFFGQECVWKQSSIRKRHTPSSMNFNELVNELKSPVKEM